jgi:RimJ/RimL family protein N-acetyltransferase
VERCREHGATRLVWQTASDNHRAQAPYARVGATRDERWLDHDLPVQPSELAGAEALFPDGQGPARRLPPLGEWLCCASRPLVVPVGLAR